MTDFIKSITAYDLFIQAIGVIGIIASILSFQCKEHSRLMVLRTVNELFFALQYGLLGAFTGMAMNIIGSARNIIFIRLIQKKKSTNLMRGIISIFFIIFAAVTRDGFKSILIGIAKVISTIAYGCEKTYAVRLLVFITSASWLVYNLWVGSLAGAVCELLSLISIIVGIIRIDLPALKKKLA